MRNVKVEILFQIMPTRDCIVGKQYDAVLVEKGETVPESHHAYPGQVNDFGDVVCFFDEVEEDIAIPLMYSQDSFKVVEIN